jgi:cytochrome P450
MKTSPQELRNSFSVFLLQHPKWLAAVRGEMSEFLFANFGSHSVRGRDLALMLSEVPFPVWDTSLPTTEACIQETVRLITDGGFLRRNVGADTVLDGHIVRTGEVVVMTTEDVNRDPVAFPDPDSFNPSRDTATQNKTPAGLGWSTGIFACQGKRYTSVVLKALTVFMLQEFDLEILTPEGKPYDGLPSMHNQLFIDIGRLAEPTQLRYHRKV